MSTDRTDPGLLRVGITGHRVLPEPHRVELQIAECLARLLHGRDGKILTLSSALAAGADQLAARVTVDRLHGSLHAFLPMSLNDYSRDFNGADAVTLRVLTDRASRVFMGPAELSPRDAAYEWAGRKVVDASDWLLACWDGLPSQGRGGTAEIVAYAHARGTPVIRIDTNPGGGVCWPGGS